MCGAGAHFEYMTGTYFASMTGIFFHDMLVRISSMRRSTFRFDFIVLVVSIWLSFRLYFGSYLVHRKQCFSMWSHLRSGRRLLRRSTTTCSRNCTRLLLARSSGDQRETPKREDCFYAREVFFSLFHVTGALSLEVGQIFGLPRCKESRGHRKRFARLVMIQ
jgi:hypothetical protein